MVLNCHVESEADPSVLPRQAVRRSRWPSAMLLREWLHYSSVWEKRILHSSTPADCLAKTPPQGKDLMGTGDKPCDKGVSTGQDALFEITSKGYAQLRSSMTAANLWVCLPTVT